MITKTQAAIEQEEKLKTALQEQLEQFKARTSVQKQDDNSSAELEAAKEVVKRLQQQLGLYQKRGLQELVKQTSDRLKQREEAVKEIEAAMSLQKQSQDECIEQEILTKLKKQDETLEELNSKLEKLTSKSSAKASRSSRAAK